MRTPSKRRCSLPARDADISLKPSLISISAGSQKKRSCVLLSPMYSDVQPRAQSHPMCDALKKTKRVILLVIEEKKKDEGRHPFLPSSIY